jgi:hypothetical protein
MSDEPSANSGPTSPTPRSIPRIVIGAMLIGMTTGVVGLLVGATIGGNMADDFRFAGNRGYEATGVMGALIGFVVGIVGGAIALACLPRKNKPS